MGYANAVLENVFGTIGAVLWTIQIIPQIWKSWRTKDTEGLSAWLMLTWAVASIFLGTYVVVQDVNVPIIVSREVLYVACKGPMIDPLTMYRSNPNCLVYYLPSAGPSACTTIKIRHSGDASLCSSAFVFYLEVSRRACILHSR